MKAKATTSKNSKRTLAKKNAEAQKAAKKAVRTSKSVDANPSSSKKGKSLIAQGKKKK